MSARRILQLGLAAAKDSRTKLGIESSTTASKIPMVLDTTLPMLKPRMTSLARDGSQPSAYATVGHDDTSTVADMADEIANKAPSG